MRKGFTGSQTGTSKSQMKRLHTLFGAFEAGWELHHGDCIGSDEEAHVAALLSETCARIVIHPPTASKKRAWCRSKHSKLACSIGKTLVTELPVKPYIERNHDIVDATDSLVATPNTVHEVRRSGTWATIRYAKRMHKPVEIIDP
jgi:hypothetical protein